jgi:hypothetical protein
MKSAIAIWMVFAVAAVVHGQQTPPIPDHVLKQLESMVGTWQIEGTLEGVPAEGTWRARWSPGKHCLMRESHLAAGLLGTGIGVIGWDPVTERITEQVFFNTGEAALLRWSILPSGDWEGVIAAHRRGRKIESTAQMIKKGLDEVVYIETLSTGEKIELTLRKIPGSEGGAEKIVVPPEAVAEMQYRVGQWTSVGFIDDDKQEGPAFEIARWVPGEYCVQIESSWVNDGVKVQATAVVGWDAEAKQLVEHWYISDGAYATFRYVADEEKKGWVGTFKWIFGDGKSCEGESVVVKKSQDEWEWTARFEEDGKQRKWGTVNHRVK